MDDLITTRIKQKPWSYLFSRHLQNRLPVLLVLAVVWILPANDSGHVFCIFRIIFDYPCPFCGLTRSIGSIIQFRLYDAFAFHPLGIVLFFYLLAVLITNSTSWCRGMEGKRSFLSFLFSHHSILGMFLIYWLITLMFFK